MSRLGVGLAVVGLVVLLGSSVHAQAAVGGWGPGFGYQQFGPGFGGMGWYGGYSPYGGAFGYGAYSPYYGGYPAYGRYYARYRPFIVTPPMTVNMMGPLMQTIRQNTGRRRGGW